VGVLETDEAVKLDHGVPFSGYHNQNIKLSSPSQVQELRMGYSGDISAYPIAR
jgi:hypothetical protein